MEFFRLFTAVRPPANVLDTMVEAQVRLQDRIVSNAVRWITRENMHLTFQFLGDTPTDRVHEVIEAMAAGISLNAIQSDIDLTVAQVGAFPSARRPRVVWIGVQDPSGELTRLQRAVGDQLRARGFQLDSRPFRPHITLGYLRRRATPGAIDVITSAMRGDQSPPSRPNPQGPATDRNLARFTVSDLLLVRSILSPAGAIYSVIHSASFSPASSDTSFGESARP